MERKEASRRLRELRARLRTRDFFGVYDEMDDVEIGPDEYEDLVGVVWTELLRGSSAVEISQQLARKLRSDYGLTAPDNSELDFARSLLAWWSGK